MGSAEKPTKRPGFGAIGASLLLALAAGGLTAADQRVWVGRFGEAGLDGWQTKVFDGHTAYRVVAEDGRRVLRADSDGTASGLYREIEVDLSETPYLHWSWRVPADLGEPDERSRAGDDYPARVYVIFSGGLAFWATETINYVWSSSQQPGATWTNAFTDQARMLAVRGEGDNTGRWYHERRNVAADYRRLFGEAPPATVDAVAVMTDTDNTGKQARAFYGDIYFAAEPR
jgi:hypothetical protein